MAKTKAQQAVAAARQVKKNAKEAQRAAKKQQMEQKKKKKTEEKQAERLRKVMVTYEENNHKNERDYVVQMIDSNPAWVPKLAKVIRQGGMRILLELEEKEASAEAVDYGEKWKGKAKTLLELPTSVLQEMIMATVDPQHPVPELTSKSDEWWKACFKYQFHVDEKTPLPQHPVIRHMLVLKEMGRARVEHLGSNRLKISDKKLESMDVQDFLFYKMTVRNFQQKAGEVIDDSDGAAPSCILRSLIENEEVELPTLKAGKGPWRLSSAGDPGCMVTAQGCPLQFQAGSYFTECPEPSEKWKYEIDAKAAAEATGTFFRNQHAQANQQASGVAGALAASPARRLRLS